MVAASKLPGAAAARRRTMIAAISGGVDSAVAAALYAPNVDAAVFMSNWTSDTNPTTSTSGGEGDPTTVLCTAQDERDARKVVEHLQIPELRRLSFSAEYWLLVFEPYVNALANETGNPDMGCNRYIKFGALRHKLDQIYNQRDYGLITGHYARLWRRRGHGHQSIGGTGAGSCADDDDDDVPASVQNSCSSAEIDWLRRWMAADDKVDNLLLQAADCSKDQSYFLSTCQAPAMRNVHFPIGDFCSKTAVRAEAARLGLPNAAKPDSVGLCFVPTGKHNRGATSRSTSRSTSFATFLSEYLPALPTRPVRFVDVDTHQVVGVTDHFAHAYLYTRGKGAKLGGVKQKYFCVSTNAVDNTVIVCQGTHHPTLYSQTLHVESIVWWTGKAPPPLTKNTVASAPSSLRVLCRTRHLVPLVPATIIGHTVHLDEPVRAVTPGQYAVFYVGVVCLGGGKIVAYE